MTPQITKRSFALWSVLADTGSSCWWKTPQKILSWHPSQICGTVKKNQQHFHLCGVSQGLTLDGNWLSGMQDSYWETFCQYGTIEHDPTLQTLGRYLYILLISLAEHHLQGHMTSHKIFTTLPRFCRDGDLHPRATTALNTWACLFLSFFLFFNQTPSHHLYRSTTCSPQSRMSHKSSAVCSASHPWPTDSSVTANELLDGAERGGTRRGMEVGLPRHQSLRREIVLSLETATCTVCV